MTDPVKRAEELTAGITPGEWEFVDAMGACILYAGRREVLAYKHSPDEENRANSAFISASPSLVRELVAEVKALREEREKALGTLTASALAHRACCGTEHDPANGKIHGYCVVCGVPWPCETAKSFMPDTVAEITSLRGVVEKVRETITDPRLSKWRTYSEPEVKTLLNTVLSRLPKVT